MKIIPLLVCHDGSWPMTLNADSLDNRWGQGLGEQGAWMEIERQMNQQHNYIVVELHSWSHLICLQEMTLLSIEHHWKYFCPLLKVLCIVLLTVLLTQWHLLSRALCLPQASPARQPLCSGSWLQRQNLASQGERSVGRFGRQQIILHLERKCTWLLEAVLSECLALVLCIQHIISNLVLKSEPFSGYPLGKWYLVSHL